MSTKEHTNGKDGIPPSETPTFHLSNPDFRFNPTPSEAETTAEPERSNTEIDVDDKPEKEGLGTLAEASADNNTERNIQP